MSVLPVSMQKHMCTQGQADKPQKNDVFVIKKNKQEVCKGVRVLPKITVSVSIPFGTKEREAYLL